MKRRRRGMAVTVAVWLTAGTCVADAAPIRTTSPSTGIFLGNVLVPRVQFVEATRPGIEVSTRVVPLAGFYSPTTNTLLGLVVPYVERRLKIQGAGRSSARGLGDVSLIGHYRFWNRLRLGAADMAALRIALELPTGSTGRGIDVAPDEATRRMLQPGSGSTDFTFLLAAAREHYRYNIDADIGYRLNTEGDGFRFGDRLFADLSLQAFVLPATTRARGFEVLSGVELGVVYEERSRLGSRRVRASGGTSLFIAPGLQVIASERLMLELSVRFGAVQALHGAQPKLDHDVLAGLRWAF